MKYLSIHSSNAALTHFLGEKTEFFQCHDKTIAQYEDLKKKEKAGKLPPAWKPEKKSLEVVQMKNADMINREFHKMNIRVDTEAMYKTRMFVSSNLYDTIFFLVIL